MAGMGPAPKDPEKRARQNPTVAMTKLPAEGRKGRIPAWPLFDDVTVTAKRDAAKATGRRHRREALDLPPSKARIAVKKAEAAEREAAELTAQITAARKLERRLWADLWKTPQATQWQKLSWTRDVAQYVRHKVRAELGSLDDAKEARQQADRLGLTPMSLLRLRWEIAEPEPSHGRSPSPRGGKSGSRARRGHLSAVPSGKPAASGQ